MTLVPKEATALATSEMPAEVLGLYQQALAQGESGVGALERLIELQERIQARRAALEFSLALATFQESCPAIQRSSTAKVVTKSGASYSYLYADFEEIVATVRPHLSANGFSFTFDSTTDGKMLTCTCTLHHSHGHKMASSVTLPTESTSTGMSEQQKVGGATTYAKRQCLINVLGLSLTDPVAPTPNVAKVTGEQAQNLVSLLEETNADVARFCTRFHIEHVVDLPATLYNEAVRLLELKRKAVKP